MEAPYAELIRTPLTVVAGAVLAGAVIGLLFVLIRRSGIRSALFNGGFYAAVSCALLGVYFYNLRGHVESLAAQDRERALCMRLQAQGTDLTGRVLRVRITHGKWGPYFCFTWEFICPAGHLHPGPGEEYRHAPLDAKAEDFARQVPVRYLSLEDVGRTAWHVTARVTSPPQPHAERLRQVLVVAAVVAAAWVFVLTLLFFPMSTRPERRRPRRAAAAEPGA
jgi:hypothetical protein